MRVWLAGLLVACGSSPDGGLDGTIPADASAEVIGADVTKFNGGGPFDCNGCICDGKLNYCFFIIGLTPIVDASLDAGMDDAEAGEIACEPDASHCVPIPANCFPNPSCACLLQDYDAPCLGPQCEVDPSGNGLRIDCRYP